MVHDNSTESKIIKKLQIDCIFREPFQIRIKEVRRIILISLFNFGGDVKQQIMSNGWIRELFICNAIVDYF